MVKVPNMSDSPPVIPAETAMLARFQGENKASGLWLPTQSVERQNARKRGNGKLWPEKTPAEVVGLSRPVTG
jgi:hypothetical protein